MADWEYRSETEGDVVNFRYAGENLERAFSEVYVWDLDKTYLDTSLASIGELWRTALEKAFQKKIFQVRPLLFARFDPAGRTNGENSLSRFISSPQVLRRWKSESIKSSTSTTSIL